MDAEPSATELHHTVLHSLRLLSEHVGDSDILHRALRSSRSRGLGTLSEASNHSCASGAQTGLVLVPKKMGDVKLILDLRVMNWTRDHYILLYAQHKA